MGLCIKFEDYQPYTPEKMKILHTKQLIKELRHTHRWGCSYCWDSEEWDKIQHYQAQLKAELATREHIPNKIESKAMRKAKIKKGV